MASELELPPLKYPLLYPPLLDPYGDPAMAPYDVDDAKDAETSIPGLRLGSYTDADTRERRFEARPRVLEPALPPCALQFPLLLVDA
jgi:hypothetical protein